MPLAGKRIGVIGTGSTGMQITRALAPVAGRYELYQRTPQWIFPLPNRQYTRVAKWLYRRFPALNRLGYRYWQVRSRRTFGARSSSPGCWRWLISTGCRLHLRRVAIPELRRRFTPEGPADVQAAGDGHRLLPAVRAARPSTSSTRRSTTSSRAGSSPPTACCTSST